MWIAMAACSYSWRVSPMRAFDLRLPPGGFAPVIEGLSAKRSDDSRRAGNESGRLGRIHSRPMVLQTLEDAFPILTRAPDRSHAFSEQSASLCVTPASPRGSRFASLPRANHPAHPRKLLSIVVVSGLCGPMRGTQVRIATGSRPTVDATTSICWGRHASWPPRSSASASPASFGRITTSGSTRPSAEGAPRSRHRLHNGRWLLLRALARRSARYGRAAPSGDRPARAVPGRDRRCPALERIRAHRGERRSGRSEAGGARDQARSPRPRTPGSSGCA